MFAVKPGYVDWVGEQGKISNGGVFRNIVFNEKLQSGSLNLPPLQELPRNSDPFWHDFPKKNLPVVFVADDA